jgi:Trk K+ transport system NAD-binding subunit
LTYAKACGLNVIATTRSPENRNRLEQLGANHVVIDAGEVADIVREISRPASTPLWKLSAPRLCAIPLKRYDRLARFPSLACSEARRSWSRFI